MEKPILERNQLLLNNEKEEIDLELTDSPNVTEKQNSSNGSSDPSRAGLGKSSEQIIQSAAEDEEPIIKIKKTVFDNAAGDSDEDTLMALNSYNKKKLLAQSMMDIALFSANASQLWNVLSNPNGFNDIISKIFIVFLSISLTLQILVGVTMLLSFQYNVTNGNERKMAFKFGNYVIVGVFLITVINVFISAFAVPNAKKA